MNSISWLRNLSLDDYKELQTLPYLSAHAKEEVAEAIYWIEQCVLLAARADEVRARLDSQRLEREETDARIRAIVERQRMQTEYEIAEKKLRKWQRQLLAMHAKIDQITRNIIHEMNLRHQEQRQQQQAEQEQHQTQQVEDAAVWQAFMQQLDAEEASEESSEDATQEALQPEQIIAQQERLLHEYKLYQEQETSTPEEDFAVWQDFIDDMDSYL